MKNSALTEFRAIMERELTEDKLLQIAEIIIMDRADPMLASFQQMFQVQLFIMQFRNFTFNNMHIRHAYIFTSQGKAFNP